MYDFDISWVHNLAIKLGGPLNAGAFRTENQLNSLSNMKSIKFWFLVVSLALLAFHNVNAADPKDGEDGIAKKPPKM